MGRLDSFPASRLASVYVYCERQTILQLFLRVIRSALQYYYLVIYHILCSRVLDIYGCTVPACTFALYSCES